MKVRTALFKPRVLAQCYSAGMYKGGTFKFRFKIPDAYPHEPPIVTCMQKVSKYTEFLKRL